MKKIKGVIDRFEGDKAVFRYNGSEIIFEKESLKGFSEGDKIVITISSDIVDQNNSNEVAKALLDQVLKGE